MTKTERAKLRWDCVTSGCFNRKCRPKIEVFAELFPGAIYMGDVDGLVEINGHFFLMEWKTHFGTLPKGQEIMYQRLAMKGFYVLVVSGDAETMEVSGCCSFWGGNWQPWQVANMDNIRGRITRWVAYATGRRI